MRGADLTTLALPVLADPVNRSHPLNQGKAGWWMVVPGLDGGKFFYNLMGYSRDNFAGLGNGTLVGMTTAASGWRGTTRPGGYGHLLFDGVDDTVSLSNFSDTVPITMGCWIKLVATAGTEKDIWAMVSGNSLLFLYGVSSKFGIFTRDGSGGSTLSSNLTPVANVWYHVVLVMTAASRSIYINGLLDISDARTCSPGGTTTNTLGSQSSGNFINAAMDDFSLYNRALSAQEVFAWYELSRRGYPDVLNLDRGRAIFQTKANPVSSGRTRNWFMVGDE